MNHLQIAKEYWKNLLNVEDVVIDATCGNGKDTLYLAKLPIKALYAIDIQKEALQNTKTLLENNLTEEECSSIFVCELSHEKLRDLPLQKAPKLIVYNLGYLPGGNKEMTTLTKSTLLSLEVASELIQNGGAISLTCYPGHPEGKKEEEEIIKWVQKLSPKIWEVRYHKWLNKAENSPTFLWLKKFS